MISLTLDLPSDQKVEGTVATTVEWIYEKDADFSGFTMLKKYACDEDDRSNLLPCKIGEQMMDQITIKDLEVYANHGFV